MKLEWHSASSGKFPTGFWYAHTNDLGYDGEGVTPLDAVSDLCEVLEREFVRNDE